MLIKSGTLVTHQSQQAGDLRIEDGRIVQLGDLAPLPGEEVYDARGRLVLPGVIDSHTHFLLRARGAVTADDAFSGGRAAALGGVTTVIDYADLLPTGGMAASILERMDQFQACPVDYSFHLVVNDNFQGAMTPQFHELRKLGIGSVKLFTTYKEAGYMLGHEKAQMVLMGCREAGILVTVHAEADDVVSEATQAGISAGKTAPRYHPDLRPAQAEALAVKRLAELSQETGCPVYIVHLSSQAGLEVVRQAQELGIQIIAETCPHYLLLDRTRLEGPQGAHWLMTPPLREKQDNQALWQGLSTGLISTVATDHCAFTPAQKALGNDSLDILPGIPGVETLLPLTYTYGVEGLGLPRLVEVLCHNPAQLFGLTGKGSLTPGSDADLVIYDPTGERILAGNESYSQAGYNPFAGLSVKGRVEATILRGRVVVKDGEFYGIRGGGKFAAAL
jgi:dihydropyrimidinase